MADSCITGLNFPTASLMEQLSTNFPIVWEEICMIQQAVLSASSLCSPVGGQMCTTVGGATPMTFITGLNSVTVVNGGAGYFKDTPAVSFVPPYSITPSIVATGTPVTNGGAISQITIGTAGAGYQPVSATITTSGSGAGAVLRPLVNPSGQIIGVAIIDGGSGYTVSDSVIAHRAIAANPAYQNAVLAITAVSGGVITDVQVITVGSGYQDSVTTVKIVSTLNNTLPYPTGTGFMSTVTTTSTAIATLGLITGGSLYTDGTYNNVPLTGGFGTSASANITILGGTVTSVVLVSNGTNYRVGDILSAAVANIGTTGSGFKVPVATISGGAINSIIVSNTGQGYADFLPYLVITDPGTGAKTTVTLGTGLAATSVASIAVNSPGNNYTQLATGAVFNPPTASLPNPPATPAVVTLNIAQNTFGTIPGLYYQVFAGLTTNKPIQLQMNAVLSYFIGLGYTITQQINPASGSTFQWRICW